jgi:hypothetical protein
MKTINDIIKMMYENPREYCPEFICWDCSKSVFCWCNSRAIAFEYIMREGTI